MRNTLAPTLPDSSLTAFYVSPVFTVPDACLIRAFEILFSLLFKNDRVESFFEGIIER